MTNLLGAYDETDPLDLTRLNDGYGTTKLPSSFNTSLYLYIDGHKCTLVSSCDIS